MQGEAPAWRIGGRRGYRGLLVHEWFMDTLRGKPSTAIYYLRLYPFKGEVLIHLSCIGTDIYT